jgi:hypothetical protein
MKSVEKKDAVLRMRLPESCLGINGCRFAIAHSEDDINYSHKCAAMQEQEIFETAEIPKNLKGRLELCPLEEVAWAPPQPLTNFERFRAELTVEMLYRYFHACERCPAKRHCDDIIGSGTRKWEGCEKVVREWANLPADSPAEEETVHSDLE